MADKFVTFSVYQSVYSISMANYRNMANRKTNVKVNHVRNPAAIAL